MKARFFPSFSSLLVFGDKESQSISTLRNAHKIKLQRGDLATHRHQRAVRTFPPWSSVGRRVKAGMTEKAIS